MENKTGEKLLEILEYIALQREPLRLMDISEGLGINSSTALRYLTTLINTGYIERDKDTLRYSMTYKIWTIANNVSRDDALRNVARPYMEEIAATFRESVCVSVEEKMQAVYVEVIRGSQNALVAFQQVGSSGPMHCTGNGKLLLLNYSDEELDAYIAAKGLKQYTKNTFFTKESLVLELNRIRAKGYAYDEEEREIGIRCIAVPIYNAEGKVIAGLSVSGPKVRMTDSFLNPKIPYLLDQANAISKKMGYNMFE